MRWIANYILILGLAGGWLSAQETNPEPTVGYIRIFTDTDLVQIYLDGKAIGYSPILENIPVTPGWHTVSFFPPDFRWTHWTHRQRRTIANVIESGTRQVAVEPGAQVEVELEWHDIERRLVKYKSAQRIGNVVGLSMVTISLLLIARSI